MEGNCRKYYGNTSKQQFVNPTTDVDYRVMEREGNPNL